MLLPQHSTLQDELLRGDFRAVANKVQHDTVAALAALTVAQFDKRLVCAGREWSVMGFLWGADAHREFSIGSSDIDLRQADVVAPEFLEFNPPRVA